MATNVGQRVNVELASRIRTSEYQPIARVFLDGFSRIRVFHWFPIELIFLVRLTSTAHAIAAYQLGIDPADLFRRVASPEEDALGHQIFEKLKEDATAGYGSVENAVWRQGNMGLKGLLEGEISGAEPKRRVIGVEAVLAAIITAAYGALETMAGDLWTVAVNRHPQLATNWVEKNNQKQINIADVAGHDFNLTNRMGTILTQSKKVQFNSFHDIRRAYQDAFREGTESIFKDCTDVLHAEKVRHLIAHRAGIIDAKFREEMKDRPEYQGLAEGQQIPLDGPTVAKHFGACLSMGEAIILAVDEWSSTAPVS